MHSLDCQADTAQAAQTVKAAETSAEQLKQDNLRLYAKAATDCITEAATEPSSMVRSSISRSSKRLRQVISPI